MPTGSTADINFGHENIYRHDGAVHGLNKNKYRYIPTLVDVNGILKYLHYYSWRDIILRRYV